MNTLTIISLIVVIITFMTIVIAFIINNSKVIKYEALLLLIAMMIAGIAGIAYSTNYKVNQTAMQQQSIGFNRGYTTAITEIKNTIQIYSVGSDAIELEFGDGDIHSYNYSYIPQITEEEGFGAVKTYEGYKMITDTTSKQYKLNNLPEAYTDDNGMRKIYDYYLVAMGSYYGNIGDIFQITLSSGRIMMVIKGDTKANQHTDAENKSHLIDGSVIEFITDQPVIESKLHGYGDCSYIQGFEGSITNIELIGHYNF